jgi:hypothetical protein
MDFIQPQKLHLASLTKHSNMADELEKDHKLLQLGGLIQSAIASYVAQRQSPQKEDEGTLPSKPLFDAQKTLLSAAGLLTELVSEPRGRLLEVSSQYFEARALHIAADKRVADILAENGSSGVDVQSLAKKLGIESRKLCRYFLTAYPSPQYFEIYNDSTFLKYDVRLD